jgi:nicotinamidase-related amidase
MKVSDFTQDNSAMLLIDHQVGTMKLIKNLPLSEVEKNTIALANIAKVLKLPVVLTSSQEDRFQGSLMTALAESLPEAYNARVKRAGLVNAWDDENFVKAVKETNWKMSIFWCPPLQVQMLCIVWYRQITTSILISTYWHIIADSAITMHERSNNRA